jgi:outer membrane receptor protein involved in Fe transport
MKKFIATLPLILIFSVVVTAQSLTDTLQIEEVVVTGSRIEVSRRNVPVTVSTVSREQIELSNESAVLPVLSHRIPGMFVTERGVTGFGLASGSAGQISMRGVGGTAPNTQVLVLIDGHPQMQGLFAHPLPDSYVSSDVEKVEVIRGPASILYGSNAMAGTINIITRQQTREGFSGNARVSYGSFNTQKYMASGGLKEGRFSLFASINHDRTDGHRDTSDFKIINGFVKAGYMLNENFNITADFSIADFTSEDPGTIYNPEYFGIDIMRGRASVAIKNQFTNLEGGLIGFYNFGRHEFTNGWISEDYHAGISLFQGFSPFAGNRITVGADYKKVSGIANNVPPVAADIWHEVDDMAAYAFMQQSLFNKLIISAGFRLENNSLFGTETVPQAGFSFIATETTTIKGSVSKGFRSPSIMELYLFAPNPDLKPERLWNYELGVNYRSLNRRFSADFTVFLLDGENMIEVVPPPPPPAMRQNVGSFSNKGFEAELNWIATPSFSFSGNYSYIDLDAPRIAAPKHQLYLESTYRNQDFRANLSAKQISDLYTFTGNEPILESFTLVNLMISYRINRHLEIFASGKNLLNQEYTINYGYPMPGIHFMTGVNASF